MRQGVSDHGYFMKGKHPYIMHTKKRLTFSLVMAINKENIMSYSLQNKAFNSSSFFILLRILLIKFQMIKNMSLLWIMSHFISLKKSLIWFIQKVTVLFLFHRILHNAILLKKFFSELKRKYRSCDNPSFIDKIKESITQINQKNLKGYFNHSFDFTKKRLNSDS